jgi:ribosomal protein S27AE
LARSRWAELHWDAILAHKSVARAIAAGRLVPEPCEVCGRDVSLAHHDDYQDRLNVRWLCDRHHRLWHIDHPLTEIVLAPPPRPQPVQEVEPARGKVFRRYKKPRALALRRHGASYQEIAQAIGISVSTAHAWAKEP